MLRSRSRGSFPRKENQQILHKRNQHAAWFHIHQHVSKTVGSIRRWLRRFGRPPHIAGNPTARRKEQTPYSLLKVSRFGVQNLGEIPGLSLKVPKFCVQLL